MNWNEVLIALAVGVPSLILGVLAYQRSRKVDAVSAQSGLASDNRAGTAQVIEGLRGLVADLQKDNDNVRAEITRGVADAERRCSQRIEEAVAELRQELNTRPTRGELLDVNGKLRKQLLDLGETPKNGQ